MDDPRLIELKRAVATHAAAFCERKDHLREAAVALIVRPREQLELLLIKRATHERDPWSGHIALPGGRGEPSDADLIHTAMRETHEEVGIVLRRDDQFIGTLDEIAPRNKRLPPLIIAPYVFGVSAATSTSINTAEVEAAMWVPLAALRDERAVSEILIELEGGSKAFPSLKYGEHVIWGLTHRILVQFLSLSEGL